MKSTAKERIGKMATSFVHLFTTTIIEAQLNYGRQVSLKKS